ncbi:unnamed protein product [Prunus armeniaca]|uniref:Uncharacterized protein n=1 Tax=Prunus armeniaca TaxID=36596 RepID=A0A6J5VCM7_PRUAR|nr:hypothetical protein GBA52_024610 [Prunus armeniaca]CAB4285903.1 unnamed protein product [Prunus armeniaca]
MPTALKNAVAALSDHGHDETQQTQELKILQSHNRPLDPTTEPPPPPPPHLENLNLPPPPLPLPTFTPSPIKRATSLQAMSAEARKIGGRRVGSIIAEEDEEEEDHENDDEDQSHKGFQRGSRNGASETMSSPPRKPEMKPVPPMPESEVMA